MPKAAAHGKRVQCQGGAKNHVVVMPDADLEMSAKIVSDSAFGCAGQRCLAVSVGDHGRRCAQAVSATRSSRSRSNLKVGNGLEEGVQMGPVISPASKTRIEGADRQGAATTAARRFSTAATPASTAAKGCLPEAHHPRPVSTRTTS